MNFFRIASRVAEVLPSDRSHWGRITYKVNDAGKAILETKLGEIQNKIGDDLEGMQFEDIDVDPSHGYISFVYYKPFQADSPKADVQKILSDYDTKIRNCMTEVSSLFGLDMYCLSPSSTPTASGRVAGGYSGFSHVTPEMNQLVEALDEDTLVSIADEFIAQSDGSTSSEIFHKGFSLARRAGSSSCYEIAIYDIGNSGGVIYFVGDEASVTARLQEAVTAKTHVE